MTEEIINDIDKLDGMIKIKGKCGYEIIGGCSDLRRLEQENRELKKQIESQKGLITVGGKQQYEYLQKVDELEQENKELKEMYRLSCLKCEYKNTKADVDKYRSALEEILENLVKLKTNDEDDFTYEYSKIEDKINGVLE